jgi:RNA polymerase sigma-70 factor (ECF subfamily)
MRSVQLPINSVNQLYSEHHLWLRNWLYTKLNCQGDAADLSQDTFVRVLSRPQHVEQGLREPRSYLITIARGLTIDLFRRRTLEAQYLQALSHLPPTEWPSEEHKALALEVLTQLDTMLEGLGQKVKQVFILAQLDGLAYVNIAEQLDISLRTVNNYMAKAMEHCCLFRLSNPDLLTSN